MTNIFDQLTDLAARASAGGEVFEDAVSIGTTARTNADLYRLALGELASTITARYGDANVARFAQAVGYEPRTVREWRQVTTFWGGLAACAERVTEAPVSYSHLRELARLDDFPAAVDLLERASDGGVERARTEARNPPTVRRARAAGGVPGLRGGDCTRR
ncbi:MAG: hypothetical protein UZ13_02016, partial [Chloroflexi bacterium OLB13]